MNRFWNSIKENPMVGRVLPILITVLLAVSVAADFAVVKRNTDLSAKVLAAVEMTPADFFHTGVIRFDFVELLDADYVRENLRFEPEAEFSLDSSDGPHSYTVTVQNPQRVAYEVSLIEPYRGQVLRWAIPAPPLEVSLLTPSVDVNGPIKLRMTEQVSPFNLERFITFDPEIKFHAIMSGDTVSILPSGPLEYGQSYQLTVGGGLRGVSGNKLGEDARFAVRTHQPPAGTGDSAIITSAFFDTPSAILAPDSGPLEMTFQSTAKGEVRATIKTYRFPDIENYTEQARLFVTYGFEPSDSLEETGSTLGVLSGAETTLSIPHPGQGGFLIEAVLEGDGLKEPIRLRKALYVSGLSVYMQSMNGRTLVWANSSLSGEALPGHTVEFIAEGETTPYASGETTSDGVAIVNRHQPGKETDDYYYDYYGYVDYSRKYTVRLRDPQGEVVYVDGSSIIAPASQNSGQFDKYYSAFYTDRAIYKPTDEIHFWGYVKPHAANTEPMPSTIQVTLGNQDITVTVPVDDFGTFNGVIKYEQIKSSQYDLTASLLFPASADDIDGQPRTREFEYAWLDIKDYEKPLFTISSETDREFYMPGDTVTAHITPKFYDGTPLPNYTLEFSTFDSYYGNESDIQLVETDEKGAVTVQFPASTLVRDRIGWTPMKTRYKVKIASDGQNITHYGDYIVFPSDTMLTGSIEKQPNGNLTIHADTHAIALPPDFAMSDIQNRYSYESNYYSIYRPEDYGPIKGSPRDMTVTAELDYRWRDRQHNRYEDSRTVTFQTTDGTGSLPDVLPTDLDPSKPYSLGVTFTVTDSAGRSVAYQDYYSYYPYGWREPGEGEEISPGYSFAVSDEGGVDKTGSYFEYMTYNQSMFGDHDEMNFALLKDGEPAENKGRILYTLLQNDVIQSGITSSRQITLTQNVNWAQSITVCAAYFDGKEVHAIRDTLVEFEMNSVQVDIDVAADKDAYMPGDTVQLAVTVTETESGNPVQGNAVVSVVDEAVFSLREQYVNVVNSLYGDMYFYNYFIPKYTTSLGDLPYPGGGDGGKGGDDASPFYDLLRKNFKDTAAFLPIRTDASGQATVTFTLPDNLTSWRITTLSVGDNLYGGQAKHNIISTLPFFMNPVISSKYVYGDEVAMLIQGHGTALHEGSQISYSVRLSGDGFDQTQTAEGLAYEAKALNFGKLEMGEYTLSATAEYLGYRDTVELPVYVIPSNLELVVNKKLDLSKPLDLNALRYPVTISFYDKQNTAYYESISSLLTHYCMIANQRMSRFVAKRALSKYMDPTDIPQHIRQGNDTAADMQNEDGGIGWYPGDPSEPILTAKVLLVADDQFNQTTMIRYFHDILASYPKPRDKAAAYLGLAALGEPITDKVQSQLASTGLSGESRAYLIAALAYAGETDLARKAYDDYFSPRAINTTDGVYFREQTPAIQNRYPKNGGYISTNKQEDARLTAAAWIAASKLGHPDADGISIFFAKESWRIDTLFECMIYVTNYSREIIPTELTYSTLGQDHTLNLGAGGQRSIALNRSEMESFRIDTVPDSVTATAYYIGEPSEVDITPSDSIQLEKTITKISDSRYRVDIDLKLLPGAPEGDYDISEWVPSNMRLYSVLHEDDYDYSRWWWSYTTEGQKLRFRVWRSYWTEQEQTIRISYIAQKTYDSAAVIDSTYVIHGNSGENTFTQRYTLDENAVEQDQPAPDPVEEETPE